MNSTFSFFNLYLAYITHRNPECPHILYNEDNGASCCQADIVELHNKQRLIVSPRPLIGVLNMVWDSVLADQAQNITRKCKFKHERVEDSRFHTRQNMYLKCSKSDNIQPNWTQVVMQWFAKDKIRPNYALSTTGNGQLEWKKLHSQRVGCGYANYKIKEEFFVENGVDISISDYGKDFCQIYVCVYGFKAYYA